jgi:hypothetical protein
VPNTDDSQNRSTPQVRRPSLWQRGKCWAGQQTVETLHELAARCPEVMLYAGVEDAWGALMAGLYVALALVVAHASQETAPPPED